MGKRLAIIVFTFSILLSIEGRSQQIVDSSYRTNAIVNLIGFYYQSIGAQAHLYNAPLYEPYIRRFSEGHPYFLADSFSNGSVFYDGLEYKNVPLQYDLVRDELVMLNRGAFKVSLIKEKIDSFSLSGHSFIKLTKDGVTGFYDQLYSGGLMLLAKRTKEIQEASTATTIETKVYSKVSYTVLKNGVYYSIKKKSSLIDVLKDRKKELQQYIRNNHLKFKNNKEADMAKVVKYYDLLTQKL